MVIVSRQIVFVDKQIVISVQFPEFAVYYVEMLITENNNIKILNNISKY